MLSGLQYIKHGNSYHSCKIYTRGGVETRQLLEIKAAGIRKDLRQDMLYIHMK